MSIPAAKKPPPHSNRRDNPLQHPKNRRETLTQASKRRCYECNGGHITKNGRFRYPEGDCTVLACPMWPYYLGRNRWLDAKYKDGLVEWRRRQDELHG